MTSNNMRNEVLLHSNGNGTNKNPKRRFTTGFGLNQLNFVKVIKLKKFVAKLQRISEICKCFFEKARHSGLQDK